MSAVLKSADSVHGDEGVEEYTLADEAQIECIANARYRATLASADFWKDILDAQGGIGDDVPAVLARCMANLPDLCRLSVRLRSHIHSGAPILEHDLIGLDAFTAAFSGLERDAKAKAYDRDAAERAFEAGDDE